MKQVATAAAPARRIPRLKANLPIQLEDGWRGEVMDLSATGLCISCIALLPTDALVEGKLQLDREKSVPVRARVAWSRPPNHVAHTPGEVGLQLVETSDEYLRELALLFARSDERV